MSNLSSTKLPDQHILQQAANWFATLSDEACSEQQKQALQNWLNANPEHAVAWAFVQKVGMRFQQVKQTTGAKGANDILNATDTHPARRRILIGGGAMSLALWFGWRFTPLSGYGTDWARSLAYDYSTGTGQTQRLAILDGIQLWLNTASAIDLDANARRIQLRTGEMLVETSKSEQRHPIVINTAQGQLTSAGSRFSVYQLPTSSILSVFDGEVRLATAKGQQQLIAAGHQTEFSENQINRVTAAQYARQAWVRGVLSADNIPLQEFIQELARYHHGYVNVATEIANTPVIGAFPADNPQQVLSMLQNALPIEVSQPLPWWFEIQAA